LSTGIAAIIQNIFLFLKFTQTVVQVKSNVCVFFIPALGFRAVLFIEILLHLRVLLSKLLSKQNSTE
jgi:hypothetical protein